MFSKKLDAFLLLILLTSSLVASRSLIVKEDGAAGNQTLSFTADVLGTDDNLSISGGNSVILEDDYDPDTVIYDDQDLSYSNDNSPTGSYVTHSVNIDSGTNIDIRDYYEPDNVVYHDNQDLSSSRNGDTVNIGISEGSGTSFTDKYEADTTIADNQGLGDVLNNGNTASSQIDMNNYNMLNVGQLEAGSTQLGSLDVYGDLNMQGNSINDIGGLQSCGSNEFVNGNGNCAKDDTIADTNAATECSGSDSFLGGDGVCHPDSTGGASFGTGSWEDGSSYSCDSEKIGTVGSFSCSSSNEVIQGIRVKSSSGDGNYECGDPAIRHDTKTQFLCVPIS